MESVSYTVFMFRDRIRCSCIQRERNQSNDAEIPYDKVRQYSILILYVYRIRVSCIHKYVNGERVLLLSVWPLRNCTSLVAHVGGKKLF